MSKSRRIVGKKNGVDIRLSDYEHAVLRALPMHSSEIRTQTRQALVGKGMATMNGQEVKITDFGRSLAERLNLSDSAIAILTKLPLPFRDWKKQASVVTQNQLIRKGFVKDDGFGCVVLTENAKNILKEEVA